MNLKSVPLLQNSRLSDNRKCRVKESEIYKTRRRRPRVRPGARYRYFSNPPTTVWLRLADIASQTSEAARLPAFDVEHSIELPCEDVFAGPVPAAAFATGRDRGGARSVR